MFRYQYKGENMKIIEGTIVSPIGFSAAGIHSGIKKTKKDLALIYCDIPASTAIATTTNIVKAAPILWCEKAMAASGKKQAVVINSGNANACTGAQGEVDTYTMASIISDELDIDKNDVLVSSTGVIGVNLDMNVVKPGLKNICSKLEKNVQAGIDASEAILTTDTKTKTLTLELEIDGERVILSGMAKGSGMIHPNMATMLSFITTDLDIEPSILKELLLEITDSTYNMVSVDGDTSTNDMVCVMASGMANNDCITEKNEAYNKFKEAFYYLNEYLAKEIILDGEGATKLLECCVHHASTKKDASILAKSVITSNLVKTAFFGEDANWGRILCSLGYSGGKFDPTKVKLSFISDAGEITLLQDGMPIQFDEEKALEILKESVIKIDINLHDGSESATAFGCDLSYEYVKINGEYRT